MFRITKEFHFSASHQLTSLPPDHQCARLHGHNYIVEITVSGQVDDKTGMVCNLTDLDGFIEREVLARYDHENLNTLKDFARDVPTTENLCIQIYEILHRGFPHAHLERVRLEETMMNSFEYAGEGKN